ncbi:MAG: hypothetical protein DRP29_08835, partial [Thermodesulfobacteriota bacterium]
ITFETGDVQLDWIDFSADVSRSYGRFLIEAYDNGNIVEDFDVRVYKQGELVSEKKGARGYCFSDYLDFGDYTILVKSDGFASSSKLIPLYENQKSLVFNLEPLASQHLQISPENVVVQTCESEETALITMENIGKKNLNVSVSIPPYVMSVSERNFTVISGTSRTLPVFIKSLPRGNYTTNLNISFLNQTETVNFNIIVYPKEDCEGRTAISHINYSTSIHMDATHIRYLPVYLKFGDYSGKVSVDVSGNADTEIFPKIYNTINPGNEVVFMLKVSSPLSDFISMNFKTSSGTSHYPIKIYVSDTLSGEIVEEELRELISFFKYMRKKVMNVTEAGYDTGDSLYALNKGMISLDLSEDLFETDPLQAKKFINLAASDLNPIIEKMYSNSISGKFPYYLLFIPLVLVPPFVMIVLKRRESEAEVKKKQKQSI